VVQPRRTAAISSIPDGEFARHSLTENLTSIAILSPETPMTVTPRALYLVLVDRLGEVMRLDRAALREGGG
jgi:hypothetical protein